MIIREFGPPDSLTELTRLLRESYAELGAMGFNYTAVDQSEVITSERIAGGKCLVAVEDTAILGSLTFYSPGFKRECPWYMQPQVAVIGQFGVKPERQRSGIGRLLLRQAERCALSADAIELALDTSEGADHLRAWYEREGFRFIEFAQWKGKTYRSVIMSKRL